MSAGRRKSAPAAAGAAGAAAADGAATATCSWCSATVPVDAARCPSCGAALRDLADGDVAGVTQVDLAATSKLARLGKPGRLATWLGAESTSVGPELAGRIEEPSEEVRKEMLRLELAAIDAEIEAKRAAMELNNRLAMADAAVAPDAVVPPPGDPTASPEDAPQSPPG